MTLKITSSQITIDNGSGVAKFNSSNKLAYLKYSSTGTVTISTADVYQPFYAISSSEFMILSFTINSCNGNVGSSLINKEIPANGSVIVDFYIRQSGTQGLVDTDIIAAALIGSNLVFKAQKAAYNYLFPASSITTNLTYRAKIYSYL